MRFPIFPAVCCIGILAACDETSQTQMTEQPALPPSLLESADIQIEADGSCVTSHVIAPAVTEMVTQQVEVIPAETAPDGMVTRPAVFRNQQVERIVTPAQEDVFETLCPPAFTTEFTASVQRALAARGAYPGRINGIYDMVTGEAVRLFQNTSGPNSQIIALQTAQDLGLVALTTPQLEALEMPVNQTTSQP